MAALLASLLPPGKAIFLSPNGTPLSGGSIATYVPNTTTPKTTWIDSGEATPNTNPITLDSAGGCVLYGSGAYRTIVKDSLGNLIYDAITQDTLSLLSASGVYGGTSTGSANVQVLAVSAVSALTLGQLIIFIAGYTNTAALTLNVSGIGATNVYKQSLSGPVALAGYEIQAGQLVTVSYDGTEFQFLGATSNTATLNEAQSFTAAQRGAPVVLTYNTTLTPDFNIGNNFSVTLTGNATLANPLNQTAGQSGQIVITQDGTGSRTLAYGGNWKFPGGTAPTLTTTANAVDILAYYVESSSRISANALLDTK